MTEQRTSVPGEVAQLPELAKFLQDFWSRAGLPPAQLLPFEIALEEIFMNVVTHGSPLGYKNRVEVCLALSEHNMTLAVEDEGPAFDPLTVQAPDVTARLEDRKRRGPWGVLCAANDGCGYLYASREAQLFAHEQARCPVIPMANCARPRNFR